MVALTTIEFEYQEEEFHFAVSAYHNSVAMNQAQKFKIEELFRETKLSSDSLVEIMEPGILKRSGIGYRQKSFVFAVFGFFGLSGFIARQKNKKNILNHLIHVKKSIDTLMNKVWLAVLEGTGFQCQD